MAAGDGPSPKKRKFARVVNTCAPCARRKVKCDRENHAPCSNCRKRRETALCEPEDPAQTAAALTGGRVVPRHQPAMPSPAFAPQPLPPMLQPMAPLSPSSSALPRLPAGPPMPMVNPQTATDPGVVALYQRLSLLEGLLPRLIYLENTIGAGQSGSPVAPSPNGHAAPHVPIAGPSRSAEPRVKIEEGFEDEEARHSPILSDTEDATLNIEDMAMGVEGQTSRSRGYGTLGTNSIAAEKLVRGESPPRACYDCNPNDGDSACEHGHGKFVMQRATPFPSIYVKEMPQRAPQSDLSNSLAPSMRPVYDNLPSVEVSRALLQRFEREVHFRVLICHMPTMLDEVEQFYSACEHGPVGEIDPAWVAMYCAMLALAAQTITEDDRDKPEWAACAAIGKGSASALWFDAARICLNNADVVIRCIQTVLYFDALLSLGASFYLPPSRQWSYNACAGQVWLNMGIRLARNLGLDWLGQQDRTPGFPDDPALPSSGSLRVELCSRIWAYCVYFDRRGSVNGGAGPTINEGSHDTPLPALCDDVDLSVSTSEIPAPAPTRVADTAFLRYQYAAAEHFVRAISLLKDVRDPPYKAILELDDHLRPIFSALIRAEPGQRLPALQARPGIQVQQLISSLMNRLLRLHRPFLQRGLNDPRYERSARTCLECAHTILGVLLPQVTNLDTSPRWWALTHVLGACLALFASRHELIGSGRLDPTIEAKERTALGQARAWFLRASETTRNPPMRDLASHGVTVVDGLFRAEADLRAGDRSSFASQLRKIGASVSPSPAPRSEPVQDPPTPALVPTTPISGSGSNASDVPNDESADLLHSLGLVDSIHPLTSSIFNTSEDDALLSSGWTNGWELPHDNWSSACW